MKPDSTINKDGLFWYLFDRLVCWFLLPLLVLFLFSLIPGIPYLIYQSYQESKAPTLELKKSDWTCTKTYTYYIYIRDTRYAHEGCSNYKREAL